MSRYRVGIVGLARISSTSDDEVQGNPSVMLPYSHTAFVRKVDDVEVVAGADPFARQRGVIRERWGIERLYADYRDMVDREKLGIVSVATSEKPQPEIVKALARAGVKEVYAEKPIALTPAEADAMVEVRRTTGIVLAISCTRRWDP